MMKSVLQALFLALSLCHQTLSFVPISTRCCSISYLSSSSLLRSSKSYHSTEKYQIIPSTSSSNNDIDNYNDNGNDTTIISRRSAISTTTGIITSSILLSQSQPEKATAASTDTDVGTGTTETTPTRNGPPLDVLVNKIEKGKYFGPDIQRMKNKEAQFVPNSNGAPEKHLPNIVIDSAGNLEVSVNHVMTEEHYIQFMWLRDVDLDEVVLVKALPSSEEKPVLKARVPKGVTLVPCLYCNLHGLWKGEAFTTA